MLAATLVVVAAFIGSTIWSQHQAHGIDGDALLISRNAAPAIALLSNARAELRDLETRVIRTIDGKPSGPVDVATSRKRVDDLLAQVDADTDEETKLLTQLRSAVRAFDEASERGMTQARSGSKQSARQTIDKEIRPLADAAGAAARDLVETNAREAEEAAVRIETARTSADRLAFELDALCALLAIGSALLAIRLYRQVANAERERHRESERKVEELEQFSGRVAHDILSPLSSVSMAIGVVEKRAPQEKEVLGRAMSSLLRVRGIVDGLLEFARAGARPEPGARTEVGPVVSGLKDELLPFAERCSASLHIEEVPDCAVACSPGVLISLLQNLLRNALKYLGDSQQRAVTLRTRARRGKVIFEVEDTGPGIPASFRSRVFEPYVRGPDLRAPGIGLGLATVKRLVESHGGEVGLRSAPGGGCLFWFELRESFPPEAFPEKTATEALHSA
jgi:signal transduction histidine kinase